MFGRDTMSEVEKIQMDRYFDELEDDVRHIIRKYGRIMGWGVPDLNEANSRDFILEALHTVLKKIESES
jgi:hypothetical protein